MNSNTNAKDYSLSSGGTFPDNLIWDNVLNYSTYFIEITCDKTCVITINQCNDQSVSPIVKTHRYLGNGTTTYITNRIIGKYISFSIKNISAGNATLYFSAVYK